MQEENLDKTVSIAETEAMCARVENIIQEPI